MNDKRKKIQIVLLLFGLVLIFSTYFLYPKVNQKKSLESKIDIKKPLKIETKQSNVFESVSYQGFYNVINPFTIKSDKIISFASFLLLMSSQRSAEDSLEI